MNNDIFKNAYLAQLGLIKEDSLINISGNSIGSGNELTDVLNGNDIEISEDTNKNPVKQVTFLTSDPAVIDAFNKGFEEVVFFVKSVDEATGEETIEEVKIGADSFGEFEVTDFEEEIDECNEITEDNEEEIEDEELIEEDEDTDLADDEDFAEDVEIDDEEIEEAVNHKC